MPCESLLTWQCIVERVKYRISNQPHIYRAKLTTDKLNRRILGGRTRDPEAMMSKPVLYWFGSYIHCPRVYMTELDRPARQAS